jgi:hypothetical protein
MWFRALASVAAGLRSGRSTTRMRKDALGATAAGAGRDNATSR